MAKCSTFKIISLSLTFDNLICLGGAVFGIILKSLTNIWHTYISWASVIGPLLVSFMGVMFLILCEPCILAHFSKHSLFPAFIDIFWQGKTITIVSTWSSGWPTGSLCGKVGFTVRVSIWVRSPSRFWGPKEPLVGFHSQAALSAGLHGHVGPLAGFCNCLWSSRVTSCVPQSGRCCWLDSEWRQGTRLCFEILLAAGCTRVG